MAYKEKPVKELIGDFYQAHANGDEALRKDSLAKIQNLIFTGSIDSTPFLEYYNEAFSGRTSFNTLMNIADYPKESIMRELLQNTFGCQYEGDDIKVVVDFAGNDEIHLYYNEMGFSMEDILYYLSFGRNSGDKFREGRFGVGAKSVFLNVEWLSLRSNNFSFKIENRSEHLKITELDLFGTQFKGTTIKIKVTHEEYEKIRDNFVTLTEKRGEYLNLVELCFSFNRKKVMNTEESTEENLNRSINLAVMEGGSPSTVYRVARFQRSEHDAPVIRFTQNGKSIVDFLFYENEGFVYLVPYAVANTKRESIVKILLERYNYFSTFELTGLIRANSEAFVQEKLSAFFISVPNHCITYCRTGIRADSEEMVRASLQRDLVEMIKLYSRYFVLDLRKAPDAETYIFYPKSYAFEFFKSYIQTSRYAVEIKKDFIDGISLQLPNGDVLSYQALKENAFKSVKNGVYQDIEQDGTADRVYIDERISAMEEQLSEIKNKVIYAAYNWANGDGSESGTVYRYVFHRSGNTYTVDSRTTPNATDYEFSSNFPTLVGHVLQNYLYEDGVKNEVDLEKIFTLFDEACDEDYILSMKYYRIHFESGDEKYNFEVSKIDVENLKNAMDTVKKRKNRFISNQNYTEVVSMLVNSFTQGKSIMEFLRTIKSQGGTITLELDFNKKYRFAVYGKQFMIPSTVTNADLIEIIGDIQHILSCKILLGRKFDFPYAPSRYAFERGTVVDLLKNSADSEQINRIIDITYVSNMKTNHIALLDEQDKIISIKEIGEPFIDWERVSAAKYVVMRSDYSKPEFADVLEYIITGSTEGILNRFFSRTKEPNLVIPDQIPFSLRPLPTLTQKEFKAVCDYYDKISTENPESDLRNFFAKDMNADLGGYGGSCEICGSSNEAINCFTVKTFNAGLMTENGERTFSLSLYMCKNCASVSDGWIICDASIGGMTPFDWLKEIRDAETIPSEFLFCRLKYRAQLSYDINNSAANHGDKVIDAEPKTVDVKLTPLMAAKWFMDNKNHIDE